MSQKFKSITGVLPAYNEEENIETAARNLLEVLRKLPFEEREVIIVNDGSTDRTGEIADRLSTELPEIRVIHHPKNLGYAKALKSGFTNARSDLIFYTDSDNQFDVREIKNFIAPIEDYDIVCGFRIYRYDPLTRLFLSWGFNLLVRIIFRIRVRDIDCAFKLFRREVFEKVTIESEKFFVDAEILAKARYHKFSMTELGVRHYPRMAGRSSVRPSHIFYTLKELAKIWINIYIKRR
ncbi:MAG: glycosyltransferase family 2 protein [Acidobacteriota bacterium]|nr:glycosyltransferase family 2 protein [Blastocatellia bacterium]MDW8412690.1 glycosyltransferase family 2 protein [Acidobacteriota bacterium]